MTTKKWLAYKIAFSLGWSWPVSLLLKQKFSILKKKNIQLTDKVLLHMCEQKQK
jgi:hypothetical protein